MTVLKGYKWIIWTSLIHDVFPPHKAPHFNWNRLVVLMNSALHYSLLMQDWEVRSMLGVVWSLPGKPAS